MEMLFTINPRPRPTVNANKNVESIPTSLIPVQDNDSQREEIDIVTNMDDVLPSGFENDDSDGEVDAIDDLCVDNSISNSEHEYSDDEASDFDNPSVPLPPPEPPDEEFDFEIDAGEEISVVINVSVEFECINAKVEFDNNDYYSFMFVIYSKVFSFLLFAESEDTIFDPGIFVESQWDRVKLATRLPKTSKASWEFTPCLSISIFFLLSQMLIEKACSLLYLVVCVLSVL
nr:hypothetical protein [Tanacetum cinerariifolium]